MVMRSLPADAHPLVQSFTAISAMLVAVVPGCLIFTQHVSAHVQAIHPCAVGFPLVGGPAGTMEGGRQSEIAKTILGAKNVPYVVAAPLLIQVCLCGGQNVRALACMLCLSLETGEKMHRSAAA